MDAEQAYKVLMVKPGASAAEIWAAYEARKQELESLLGKAPTSAAKVKHKSELRRLDQARESAIAEGAKQPAAPSTPAPTPAPAASSFISFTVAGPPIAGDVQEVVKPVVTADDLPEAAPQPELPEDPDAKLEIGRVIANRYEIRSMVGPGGIGDVYEAVDRNANQVIALVAVRPGRLTAEGPPERFLRLVDSFRRLAYPNVLEVHAIAEEKGRYFLVMEFPEGAALREAMDARAAARKKYEVNEVTDLVITICDALEFAEERNVKLEVTPESVWICPDGSPKLMDFGGGPLLGSPTGAAAVHAKAPLGPGRLGEQYWIAALAYEMLTGRVPAEQAAAPREIRDDIPAGLSQAISRAMAADPQQRFASTQAFKAALLTKAGPSQKTLVIGAAAAAALILIAVVVFFVTPRGAQQAAQPPAPDAAAEKIAKPPAVKEPEKTSVVKEAPQPAVKEPEKAPAPKDVPPEADKRPVAKGYEQPAPRPAASKETEKPALAEGTPPPAAEKIASLEKAGKEAPAGPPPHGEAQKPGPGKPAAEPTPAARPSAAAPGPAAEPAPDWTAQQFTRLMAEGKSLASKGEWDLAQKAFAMASAVKPDAEAKSMMDTARFEGLLDEGRGLARDGKDEPALEKFKLAIQVKPGDKTAESEVAGATGKLFDSAMKQAKEKLAAGDFARAMDSFNLALKWKPQDPEAVAGVKRAQDAAEAAARTSKTGVVKLQGAPPSTAVFWLDGADWKSWGNTDEKGAFTKDGVPLEQPVSVKLEKQGWKPKTFEKILLTKQKPEAVLGPIELERLRATLVVRTAESGVAVKILDAVHQTDADKRVVAADLETGAPIAVSLFKHGYKPLFVNVTIPVAHGGSIYETKPIALEKAGEPGAPGVSGALTEAAAGGDAAKVKQLLDEGIDPNSRDKEGTPALVAACDAGHGEIAELLLLKGANVDITDKEGISPLMRVAEKGDAKLLTMLLERKADVNRRDNVGANALTVAVFSGNVTAVKLLLAKGANANSKIEGGESALILAARNGDAQTVNMLLDAGADVNAKIADGRTALFDAAEAGRIEVMEALIKRGADVEAETQMKWTPLVVAAAAGKVEAVKTLLMRGARRGLELASRVAVVGGYRELQEILEKAQQK